MQTRNVLIVLVLLSLSGALRARDLSIIRASRARAAITRAGGRVSTQDAMVPTGFASTRTHAVDFSGSGLTDEQLAALVPALRDLGGIRLLDLRHTAISDRGLLSLKPLERLYLVNVTGARTTQAGSARLRAGGVYPHVVDNSGPRSFEQANTIDLLFSADGRLLAVVSADATDVWDTETGKRQATAPGGNSVAFSADGRLLGIAHVRGAIVWNLATGSQQLALPMRTQSPGAVAFSADGRFIHVSESEVHQYELATGRLIHSQPGLLIGRSHNVGGLSFGERVAAMLHPELGPVAGRLDGVHEQLRLGVVSPTGEHAAWMSDPAHNGVADGIIRIVDLKTPAVIRQLTPPPGLYLSGAFDAAGTLLAVGGTSQGRSDGQVLVYEVATGKRLLTRADPAGLTTCLALSADGRKVAAAFQRGSVKWWPIGE